MHEIGQLLDEEMAEDEKFELAEAEEVCRKYLAWDLQPGSNERDGVKERLAAVLVRLEGPE